MTNHRFLIQLVDAASEQDARRDIGLMFGNKCLSVALFVPGSQRLCCKSVAGISARLIPSASGFTVYVPEGFRIP